MDISDYYLVTDKVIERLKEQADKLIKYGNHSKHNALNSLAMQHGYVDWKSLVDEYKITKDTIKSYNDGYVVCYADYEGKSIIENKYLRRDERLMCLTKDCINHLYHQTNTGSYEKAPSAKNIELMYFRIQGIYQDHNHVKNILKQQLFWPCHIWFRRGLSPGTVERCCKLTENSKKPFDPAEAAKTALANYSKNGTEHPLSQNIMDIHKRVHSDHWRYRLRFRVKNGTYMPDKTFERKQDARKIKNHIRTLGGSAQIYSIH